MKLFSLMETSFDNFDNTVRNYLSKTFNNLGMQYTHSQIFGVIFDGIRGIMQNIMFYIEDALTEQNIFTASRKQSVYALAKLSGYEPNYGTGATGTLIGSLTINNNLPSNTSKIFIKNHAQLKNRNNGLIYSLMLPNDYYILDVAKPIIKHEFSIIQGSYTKNNYTAKGHSLETIVINCGDLFDGVNITVTVDGKPWTRVGNLYDMTEEGEEYIINVGFNNGFEITFGNGTYGKKLKSGQTVIVEFLKHAGTLGNIMPNEISKFVFSDYGTDVFGNNININDYLTLKVNTCLSGGTNSDSIKFIREMVGSNSRSSVLVSEDNFKLFFKRFSFIGYTNCWTESNSMIINVTCLRNFKNEIKSIEDYYNITTKNLFLTNEQKIMVKNTLENSNTAFAGLTLKFQDPILRKFAVICYVKLDNTYNKELASTMIKRIFAEYFFNSLEDTQFISKSNIIKKIHNDVTCIKFIDFDFISELEETSYYNGYYDKYEIKYKNLTYSYYTNRIVWENNLHPGLDGYGNISLDSKLEIPILSGGFKYYADKSEQSKDSSLVIDTIQIYFIS